MIRFDRDPDFRRRIRYAPSSRGPIRAIAAWRREHGECAVELDCGHTVARRRVLASQTATNCEVCKAVTNGTRTP